MLKILFQRWFKGKSKHEIMTLRRRIALLYAFLGWNTFGILFYLSIKNQMPEDRQERRNVLGLLSGTPKNMHVYQIEGLTLTNDFEVAYKAKVAQIEKEKGENENVITETDEH